mgnify:FL=1
MEMNEEMIIEDLVPAEKEVTESGSDDSAKVLAAVGIGIVAIGVGVAAFIYSQRDKIKQRKIDKLRAEGYTIIEPDDFEDDIFEGDDTEEFEGEVEEEQ